MKPIRPVDCWGSYIIFTPRIENDLAIEDGNFNHDWSIRLIDLEATEGYKAGCQISRIYVMHHEVIEVT